MPVQVGIYFGNFILHHEVISKKKIRIYWRVIDDNMEISNENKNK